VRFRVRAFVVGDPIPQSLSWGGLSGPRRPGRRGFDLNHAPKRSRSEAGKLWRFLPGGAGADRVEIGGDPRKLAVAETGPVDHVEDRTIGAIRQAEVGAQKPSVIRELALNDPDHVGQSLFPACDRGFIGCKSEHLRTDAKGYFARRWRKMPGKKEEPFEGIRPPCRGCGP